MEYPTIKPTEFDTLKIISENGCTEIWIDGKKMNLVTEIDFHFKHKSRETPECTLILTRDTFYSNRRKGE